MACVQLRPERRFGKTIVLFRGTLAEAIDIAFTRPEPERLRLRLSCERFKHKLEWAEIATLSEAPDFPIPI